MGTSVLRVKNRTTAPYEFWFDGQVYQVASEEEVVMLQAAAEHGMRKSVISYNPNIGTAIRALVLADSPEAEEIIEGRKVGSELIERDPADGKFEKKTFANPDMRGARITSALDGGS